MNLTTAQTHSLVYLGLGLLVVLGTSLLKTIDLSPKQKHAIAGFLSVVSGYVSAYFAQNGTDDLVSIAKQSTTVYAVSQLLYGFVLQNSAVDTWLTKFNLLPSKK